MGALPVSREGIVTGVPPRARHDGETSPSRRVSASADPLYDDPAISEFYDLENG